MCLEVIDVELLYYGVIMCTALFSLSTQQKEKKKKKIGEKERKREWKKNLDPFSMFWKEKKKTRT